MADTYTETVLRFRVFRHDELPEQHQQAMRDRGEDPDARWSLVASFESVADACACMVDETGRKADWQRFKVVDAGKTQEIERRADLL